MPVCCNRATCYAHGMDAPCPCRSAATPASTRPSTTAAWRSTTPTSSATNPGPSPSGRIMSADPGRLGKQERLRQLMDDPNTPRHIKGWLKQEANAIARGQRKTMRLPPRMELAHRRGFEARKEYSYLYSDLQEKFLHRLQHKWEGYR